MKKLITLMLSIFLAYNIQAQFLCQAQFSYTVDSSFNAVFVDMSTNPNGTITSWFWNFGDGTSSTLQNVTHQFQPVGGPYLVCLTITGDSCTSTYCDSIYLGGSQNPCFNLGANLTIIPVSGSGVADGSITASVYGGTAPYVYIWSQGSTAPTINNLPVGTYCLTVVDATGCSAEQCGTVWVNNQSNCIISAYMITPESMQGAADGAIEITMYGGSLPYNYYWDNGATTEDISGLASGFYTVAISDSGTCSLTQTFYVPGDSIYNPCQLYVTGIVTDVTTIGGSDGAIDVTVFGGNPPYSILWDSGVTAEDIFNLYAGIYTINVADNNNCSTTASFIVNEPSNPSQFDTLFAGIIDTCINFIYDTVYVYNINVIDSNNVAVTWAFMGSGQIAFLTVQYSITQQGNYVAVIAVNCGSKLLSMYFDHIFVDYSTITGSENLNSMETLSVYPNPVKDYLNIMPDKNMIISSVEIYNSVGQLIIKENISRSELIKINVSGLNNGIYIINVIDINNKRLIQKFVK